MWDEESPNEGKGGFQAQLLQASDGAGQVARPDLDAGSIHMGVVFPVSTNRVGMIVWCIPSPEYSSAQGFLLWSL